MDGQHKCHTVDRHNIYECLILNIASKDDLNLLEEFIVARFERENNNNIRENDECMKRHSKVSQYWEAIYHRTLNP